MEAQLAGEIYSENGDYKVIQNISFYFDARIFNQCQEQLTFSMEKNQDTTTQNNKTGEITTILAFEGFTATLIRPWSAPDPQPHPTMTPSISFPHFPPIHLSGTRAHCAEPAPCSPPRPAPPSAHKPGR